MKIQKLAQRYDRAVEQKELLFKKLDEKIKLVCDLRSKLFDSFAGEKAVLTGLERKVYDFLLQGASNKDIANTTRVSVSCVKKHVSAILRKTHRRSRYEFFSKRKELENESRN